MPQDFNQQWADLRVSITRIEESTKYQNAALDDIRQTQQEHTKLQEAIDKRLTALEATAWTWGRFRAAWPQVAAGATIIGFVVGLIMYLIKHLHL